MKVSIAYAEAGRQIWQPVTVAESASVAEVIAASGVYERLPGMDLGQQRVGIFGKLVKPETPVKEGDRIEIYRKITRVLDEEDNDD